MIYLPFSCHCSTPAFAKSLLIYIYMFNFIYIFKLIYVYLHILLNLYVYEKT